MNKDSAWIWVKDWSEIDQAHSRFVNFRTNFTLDKAVTSAVVKVSADSRYRLYVNGVSVSFGPCKGDHFVWHYEEVDIAPHLVAGENAVCAIVLRYPNSNLEGGQAVFRTDTPGFFLEGSIQFSEGECLPIRTDSSWRAIVNRDVQILPEGGLNFLWILENAKGNAETADWLKPDYDDIYWPNAVPYHPRQIFQSISPGSLVKRPIPAMFEKKRRFYEAVCLRESRLSINDWDDMLQRDNPLTIPAYSKEVVEISACELTTGFLELRLVSGKDSVVRILTSECYAYPPRNRGEGPSLPVKGDRADHVNGSLYGFTDTYQVSGHGDSNAVEYYEPFWFRTFRYLQISIETSGTPLTVERLSYRETGYPLEVKTSVQTSDPMMSDIWDISLRTLRRCMHETYEDCPFYEQLQYAMDTRSQILFTYSISGDDRLARRCIDDFHRSLRPDGLTNCSFPAFGPNVIPGFSLFYLLMLHDHMMYFGDKSFLKKYVPTMDAILGFFDSNLNEDGLVGKIGGPLGGRFWSFVDWAPQWSHTHGHPTAGLSGPLTVENLLYAHVLKSSAEILDYLGKPAQAADYRDKAGKIIHAVNQTCLGSNGLYQDGPGVEEYSQHAQVWAVLAETVSGKDARLLMEKTLKDSSLTQCTVAMAYYLFRAVEKTGLYEETHSLWQPWRDMLKNNLTTCVESPGDEARSDCHAWGSLILYELPSVVLGVRPAKPGYEAVFINPNPAFLSWAKGEVITPKGLLTVSWEKVGGKLIKQITAPEGLEII